MDDVLSYLAVPGLPALSDRIGMFEEPSNRSRAIRFSLRGCEFIADVPADDTAALHSIRAWCPDVLIIMSVFWPGRHHVAQSRTSATDDQWRPPEDELHGSRQVVHRESSRLGMVLDTSAQVFRPQPGFWKAGLTCNSLSPHRGQRPLLFRRVPGLKIATTSAAMQGKKRRECPRKTT